MSTSSELKSTIKRLRNGAGISQKQLASIVNLSQQAVAKWESGVAEPDTRALRVLADYFGVSVDYLLGRDANEAPSEAQAISAAKLALFGGDGEVTDEMWDEALFAAKLIKERYRRKDDAGG